MMASGRQRRRQPACKECRFQKIKCDAEPPDPCSRCCRMDLACLVAPTPSARKTKAQLQRELDVIRSTQGSGNNQRAGEHIIHAAGVQNSLRVDPAAALGSVYGGPGGNQLPQLPQLPQPSLSITPLSSRIDAGIPVPVSAVVSGMTPSLAPGLGAGGLQPPVLPSVLPSIVTAATAASGTVDGTSPATRIPNFSDAQCSSQLLDEEEVSSREIRDCFTLFFDFYSPFLPILDASTSPDEYFQQSPLLFWIITYIGSRRYTRDPTLLYRLAPHINSMALLALESSRPIQTIQGILLLCLWPVPVNTMHRDFSLVLGGAALHLAMQVGLHVAGAGQDFSRTMVSGNQFERAYRARLWRHCCVVCHSTGLREGIMPLGLNDACTWSAQEDGRDAGEPAQESRFRRRIHDIMMSATTALKQVDLGSRHLDSWHQKNQDSALLSYISLFDAQLLELAPRAQTSLDSIYLQCYHIHLLAYHFLVGPASRRSEGFIRLYTLACTLLLNTCDQEDTTDNSQGAVVKHCPVFIERALMLAAMSILKIHRSGGSSSSTDMISKHLDLELGERAYFAAMVATRELSLQNDDLGARGATIMGQLWNSKSIFRKKNGEVDSLGCRVRSRLSMSVVFDCLWWWRQEFGGQGNPFTEESRMQTRRPSPAPGADGAEVMYQQRTPFEEGAGAGTGGGGGGGFDVPDTEAFMFPGEPFFDYDWATSLNVNDWFQ